jgi:hypothetical protein
MKPLHMGFLFAFVGALLEVVAIFIGITLMAVSNPGSHWVRGAIVVFCIWPSLLILKLQAILGIPAPSSPWETASLVAPMIGWGLVGALIIARWFPEERDPRFEIQKQSKASAKKKLAHPG